MSSPIFPERPIRPLPKRPIRSRLSAEVVDQILCSAGPSATAPLFYVPPTYGVSSSKSRSGSNQTSTIHHSHGHQHYHTDHHADSDEEELSGNHVYHYVDGPSDEHDGRRSRVNGLMQDNERARMGSRPPAPESISSSIDGYESFENTNNKKKRKVPTSGNSSGHHSHLSSDMTNMGLSSPNEATMSSVEESGHITGQYYGSGYAAASSSGSNGKSGPGRGQYGRKVRSNNFRTPLGISTDGTNSRGGRRTSREWGLLRDDAVAQKGGQGIISTAIANSKSTPTADTNGQENTGLLHKPPAKTASNASSQFTFTAESNVHWPGAIDGAMPPSLYPGRTPPIPRHQAVPHGMATQGTQTSPHLAVPTGQPSPYDNAAHQQQYASQQQPQQQQPANQQPPPPPKKNRRRTGKEYLIAARQRRLQQEYNNFHHPPNREDIWICEFCEYESIFGSPPEALMKQYEIKDRRERRRLAEKRRLLEKAKMKGRKNKKGSKASNKAHHVHHNHSHAGHHHHHDDHQMQHQDTQSDEYYDDGYDDDPIPMPQPQQENIQKVPVKNSTPNQRGPPLSSNLKTTPLHSTANLNAGGGGTVQAI